jgi:hypothetical protein
MTEAYDAGERREIAMRTKAEADEVLIGEESTFRTTATGVRYKDQSLGQGAEVCIHYIDAHLSAMSCTRQRTAARAYAQHIRFYIAHSCRSLRAQR